MISVAVEICCMLCLLLNLFVVCSVCVVDEIQTGLEPMHFYAAWAAWATYDQESGAALATEGFDFSNIGVKWKCNHFSSGMK